MRAKRSEEKTRMGIQKKLRFGVWFITGVIICLSFAVMIISGSHSFSKIYGGGEIYDCFKSEFAYGNISVNSDVFTFNVSLKEASKRWNYLYMDIGSMSSERIDAEFTFKDSKSGTSFKEKANLVTGENILKLKGRIFDLVKVSIKEQDGASMQIDGIQFRESKRALTMVKVIAWSLLLFFVYTLLSLLGFVLMKRHGHHKPYALTNLVQSIYLILVSSCMHLTLRISEKFRDRLRAILFFVLFMAMLIADMEALHHNYYKYLVLLYCVILVCIAFLSIGKNPRMNDWNNPMPAAWLVLCGMICISDFLVPKANGWIGYLFLVCFGLLYFIWNNMDEPEKLVKNMLQGLHLTFAFVLLLCTLHFPDAGEIRYTGYSSNPSVFALYLSVVLLAAMSEVIQQTKEKGHNWLLVLAIIEVISSASLMWKTQSVGPLLTCSVMLLFLAIRSIPTIKKWGYEGKKVLAAIVLLAIMAAPIHSILTWSLKTIPYKFGAEVAQAEQTAGNPQAVYASVTDVIKDSRVYQKVIKVSSLEALTSGRTLYWKGYLQNLNWYGHKKPLKLWGHEEKAHNALLTIAYRYGILAAIPYLLILGLALKRSFCYLLSERPYSFAPFALIAGIIIMSMSDNVEEPFLWLSWIVFYIMMGMFFQKQNADS